MATSDAAARGPARGARLDSFDDLEQGLLLDVDYLTLDGRAVVRLWVKGPRGTVTLLEPAFDPYFYLVPRDEDPDLGQLAERLAKAEGHGARPRRVEPVERSDGLRTVRLLRVVAWHPTDVPKLRDALRAVDGIREHREADIPFAFRYLIDKCLRPMGGVAWRGKPSGLVPGAVEVEHVEARDVPGIEEEAHVVAFDLEVANPRGVPRPREDPILLIAVASLRDGAKVLRNPSTSLSGAAQGEKALLEAFVQWVREEDPDVIVTYNGDEFDWPYLRERASRQRVPLDLGRDGATPTSRQAGLHKTTSLNGRQLVDLLRVAERDLGDVKVKTLKNVADFLGVVELHDRVMVAKDEIHALWATEEGRERLIAYARDDAVSTIELARKLLPLQAELARVTRMPLGEAARMGRGRQVDWFLLAEAFERGIVAPNKTVLKEEVYEGGFVLEPPQGLLERVVALDFSSMYPSIMMGYNVSPETHIPPEIADAFKAGELWMAPEVGHRFLKEPTGFFPQLLGDLVARRKEWKRRMREHAPGSPEHRLADVKQTTLKILTNAQYGYLAWTGARWYKRECAEATAAWGRHLVKDVVEAAKVEGLEVLYGDTDSLFVKEHPGIPEFLKATNARLPLELDRQATFETIFFTGAKKRYAGLTDEGKVVVRGLEVRRGDWCELAKRLQEEILDTILRKRDPEAAKRLARDAVRRVREGKVDLEELTVHKTLTQDPGSYKAKQAHVHAVERARERNPDLQVATGTKVGYVVLRAKGALRSALPSERASLVEAMRPDEELDLDYYVDKQLLPAALRVLEHFGATEGDLKGAPKQQSLQDWFA